MTFVSSDSLKLQELIRDTAHINLQRENLKAHQAGVRGLSVQPSVFAQEITGHHVEAWFDPANIRFNSVTKSEVGDFVAGDAHGHGVYTQDSASEAVVQSAWAPSFMRVFELAAEHRVHWWDGHTTAWLKRPGEHDTNRKKPDGVAVAFRPVTTVPDPALVLVLTDNKESRPTGFTNDDKGKLFVDCTTILHFYQPNRPYFPCSLFDGHRAQCFRVVRTNEPSAPFRADYTRTFDLSRQEDARLYAGFLSDYEAMAFQLGESHPRATDQIGAGATGMVFAHEEHPDAVIKIAYKASRCQLIRERQIYTRLRELGPQSPYLPGLHVSDDPSSQCLILQNKFQHLTIPRAFDVSRLCTLINCEAAPLRRLHALCCVHCDVRPENLMQKSQDQLALVDLGAARFLDEGASSYEHGTLIFASDAVCSAYFSKAPIQVGICDDLISLVRCATAFLYNIPYNDVKRNEKDIKNLWADYSHSPFVISAMKAAGEVNYDDLCELFQAQWTK
jgi:hypothetical protein